MKKMILRLTMILLAFTVVFASCKKDDPAPVVAENGGNATYEGETYTFTKGFMEDRGGIYVRVYLTSEGISYDEQERDYIGTGDMVMLSFYLDDNQTLDGTYAWDPYASAENTLSNINLTSDANELDLLPNEGSAGSVGAVVTKTGDIYEITCNVIINEGELKVYYKGTLQYYIYSLPGK